MTKIHASVFVSCLKEYLDRTANIRQDHHKLLVSYQKPHKSISKDTVARWLKQELKLAGIDTSTFGAHSTRAVVSCIRLIFISLNNIIAIVGSINTDLWR